MRTVRRLLYSGICGSVAFVATAFLALFYFIDIVDELADVGRNGYTAWQAALYCLLLLPGHLYELAPIAVLIGGIYALARLAQSSEYTILRTGGLGPQRALGLLAALGLAFAVGTFVLGDYVAPWSETQAAALHGRFGGSGGPGAWMKDRVATPQGERTWSVRVGDAQPDGSLKDVRLYAFDADGRLETRVSAPAGRVDADATWHLRDASVTRWRGSAAGADGVPQVVEEKVADYAWRGTLTPRVVTAAVLPLATMSTLDLFRYIGHLADNEQTAQLHRIQFWKRALYPFACLVMVALALPFAYLHARAGGIGLKVFGGIMLGISFVLLNNVAGHLGLLRNWTPWIVAATPSAAYLLLSLAAFSWLVRYR